MNVLYSFKYKKRFQDIIDRFDKNDKSVLDICFGDTIIADHCKQNNLQWIGFDINDYFVNRAKANGHNATVGDVAEIKSFPKADVCVMCGSLYHFINEIESVLSKMVNAAPKVIISDPVENLSSQKGLIGTMAKILTNAGKGHENLRFDKTTIIETLDRYKGPLHFKYSVVSIKRDILIEIIHD